MGSEIGSDCLLLVSGSHSSEVEHFIGNEEVSGSNPDVSTRFVIRGKNASERVAVNLRFN
jgi:hypothetical protein